MSRCNALVVASETVAEGTFMVQTQMICPEARDQAHDYVFVSSDGQMMAMEGTTDAITSCSGERACPRSTGRLTAPSPIT